MGTHDAGGPPPLPAGRELDVAIVLVTHNSGRALASCLASISQAAEAVQVGVVVLDNGADDGAAALCAAHGARLLRARNRGFAAGFNAALGSLEVRRARWVLQLNPDVELMPRALDVLVAYGDERPDVGILGPRQIDQHGNHVLSIGVEPSVRGYWRGARTLGIDWVWVPSGYETEHGVDWVMGAAMLLRRQMLDLIGGMDERFFLCSEEVDLCRRARDAGWRVVYTPAATVRHAVAGRPLDPDRVRLEEWSRLLYMRKWHSWAVWSAAQLALAVRYLRLVWILARDGDRAAEPAVRLLATIRPGPPAGLHGPELEGR